MEFIHDVELFSIGKLAKAVNMTPDALRYYAEIGLLKPYFISPDTGYRYYTAAQAQDVARIVELKGFDFPLATIRDMMATPDAPMEALLRTRYAELMQEKARITQAMEKLAQKLQLIEEAQQ